MIDAALEPNAFLPIERGMCLKHGPWRRMGGSGCPECSGEVFGDDLTNSKQLGDPMYKLTKLAADGTDLPNDATGHLAVRLDHAMLAKPITWAAHRAPEEMTWAEAKKWAESLDTYGWSWRLPTIEEALFLPNRAVFPALDKEFFPDFDRDNWEWIWTSTVDAEPPSGDAWSVNLDFGFSHRCHQLSHILVRAVRAGQ